MDNFEVGLNRKRNNIDSEDAKENILSFYNKYDKFCVAANTRYKAYQSQKNRFISDPKRVSKETFMNYIDSQIVLTLTANPIENAIFLHSLYDFVGRRSECFMVDKRCYQVVKTHEITIIHLHTEKTGDEATRRAINEATEIFAPDFIFLLGICYGIDRDNHSIGNVFISEKVKGYRINFRDREDSDVTIFEAEEEFDEYPEEDLRKALCSFFGYYDIVYNIESELEEIHVPIAHGGILSSNSLISSKNVKEAVMNALGTSRPRPLGGEMEACGIFKSNYFEKKYFRRWMIIKGICDWGEKKNSLDKDYTRNEEIKDSIQAFAMGNVCQVFLKIIEKRILIWEDNHEEG